MAKTLYYDCFSGISGDMHLGALVDLGVPREYLRAGLDRLPLADEFALVLETATKMGIVGTKATVKLLAPAQAPTRRLADIIEVIDAAGYPRGVGDLAKGIFRNLAVAEAAVHGTTIDQVHFHEVGATDSIVDIVGAALCIDHLAVDNVRCGAVEVGGGMVGTRHGLLPVPAPATVELLRGVPCHYGRVDQETTTPTGAAILKQVVHDYGPLTSLVADRVGYGIGQKDFEIPNVLRVMLGGDSAPGSAPGYQTTRNLEVVCNIDDMSPEAFQPLIDALLERGALDVFLTPVVMKKSRLATKVTALTSQDSLDAVIDTLILDTTTLGVRIHDVEKRMLRRESRIVGTSYGPVQVKVATLPSGRLRWKTEHEDIMALASKLGVGYLWLRQEIEAQVARLLTT